MKRLIIVVAVVAPIFIFILYQFLFADRRSRLKVDAGGDISEMEFRPVSFKTSSHSLLGIPDTRMLVKEGTISFEVRNASEARRAIQKLAKEFEGYISDESQETYLGGVRYHEAIRIPTIAVDSFVQRIEGIAVEVHVREIASKDVTEEFIDLESRILTKKKAEERYREILQAATKVHDMMDVEERLMIVRSEIESLQGRRKYLVNQTSFGTLHLKFYETGMIASPGFGTTLAESLNDGWTGLLAFIAAIAKVWPLLIVCCIGTWFYFRRKRRTTVVAAS